MEPIKLEIFIDDKTRAGLQSASGNIGGMEKQMQQVVNVLEQDLKRLQQAFKEAMSQGFSGQKELAEIQALRGEANKLKEELKSLKKQKEETNNVPVVDDKVFVGMDDIAKKTNNLKLQFSQVARELPALAMGPQMFILAISNNLPMLADAIKDVRMQNELLKASGQKSVPVWKQLAGSLFSWQTALVAAISLGIVFGKDIWEWVKTSGKASDKLDEAKKKAGMFTSVMDTHKKSLKSSNTEYGRQMAVLAKLKGEWDKLGDSMDRKKKFINENKTGFKELGVKITGVNDAENLLVKNTTAFVEAMKLRARALAGQSTLQDLYAKKQEEDDNAEFNRKLAKVRRANPRPSDIKEAKDRNTGPGHVSSPGITSPLIYKDSKKRDWTPEDIANEYVEKVYKKREEEAEKRSKLYQSHIDRISKKMIQDFQNSQKTLNDAEIEEDNGTGKTSGQSVSDYQNELADARIRAQQKLEAAIIAVMTDGYKKRRALARQQLDEELTRIDKEERDTLKKMQEAKKKGVKISPEEERKVKETAGQNRTLANVKYMKASYDIEKEWRDKNLQQWVDYYKEYGSYQEKRIAIEKEYNNKIADIYSQRWKAQAAGDEEQADSLNLALAKATKDKGRELISLDYTELTQSPDYIRAFENLKETSTDTLDSLLEQFENAKQTAAQVLSPDELREYTTTIQEIMDELDERNPFQSLADRKEELAEAEKELAEARRNLETVNAGGKVVTGLKYNDAAGKMDKTYLSASAALEKYNRAQDKVAKSGAKVDKAQKDVKDVVDELSSAFNELGAAIGGQAGEIISLIGDIGAFAMTAMSGVTTASSTASEAVKAVEKASVILAVISTAIQVATKIASLFKDDDGIAEYERAKEVYESYIDILDRIIEKQKELFRLNSQAGKQAYEQAKETVKKQEDASRELGKQYLNAGASKGFLGMGSKASHGADQRKDMSSTAWNEAKKALGNDFYKYGIGDGRMTGLFDLSVEQLKKLQSDAPLFWAELHGDTQKYLQQIIACNDELTALENDRMEGLVKTDFSSFSDSFIDMLADLDSSSKDFADNFEEYLRNAILTSLITDKYQTRIQNLYKKWAADTESGEKLTGKEAEALREEYGSIVDGLLKERDEYSKIFGWTSSSFSSQSGRAGAVTTITEETGGRIEGSLNVMTDYLIGISRLVEELKKGREADNLVFAEIASNTAYCKMLEPLLEIFQRWENRNFKISM